MSERSGLRWGVMGTGGIAAAMAGTLRSVGSPIAAVGSERPGAAERFAAQWEIPAALDSHAAVAEHADVDVVYVATTNDRHHPNLLAAVAGGKHVLCEKPLSLNAVLAAEMLEAASDAGVFSMEAMWMRFQPFMAKLDEMVAAGEIGDVTNIQCLLSFIKVSDPSRRWLNLKLGGGSLLDLGVYPLTLIHHMLGEPERFEAVARLADTGVDLETAVVSRHGGGATATAVSSFVSDGANEAIVSGTDGRIRIHRTFHQSRLLSLERSDEVVREIDVGYDGHGFQFEVAETERCIRQGLLESPQRPHADTIAVLEWMDAIRARIGVEFPDH